MRINFDSIRDIAIGFLIVVLGAAIAFLVTLLFASSQLSEIAREIDNRLERGIYER